MNTTSKKSLWDHWNQFWFAERPSQTLSILRIFIGFITFSKLTGAWGLKRIPYLNMRFPRRYFSSESNYYIDEFRLPVEGFEWLPAPSFFGWQCLEVSIMILCIFFVVGLFTRWVGPVLALLFLYKFTLSQFTYHHHTFFITCLLLILGFSRCYDYYSIDAYLRGPSQKPLARSVLPIRFIQILLTFIYVSTAIVKSHDSWFGGYIIETLRSSGMIGGIYAPTIFSFVNEQFLGAYTVVAEWFIPIALWVPALRKLGFLVGIFLHIGIDALMGITTYSHLMIGCYLSFLQPAGSSIVFYDGRSLNAKTSKRIRVMNLLDFLRRISWIDIRGLRLGDTHSEAIQPSSDRGLVVLTPQGKTLTGFEGWRYLISIFPITFIPSFIFYVPVISHASKWVYNLIRRPTPAA